MSERTYNNHILFFFTGLGFLLIGALEYLLSRPLDSSHIGKILSDYTFLFHNRIHLFGILSGVLPDFLHPFAFSMLSMAVFSHSKRILRAFVCASWLLIDLTFELGQYYHSIFNTVFMHMFPESRAQGLISDYFISGTFDLLDVLAIIMGALLAFFISEFIAERRCIQ